MNDFEVDVAELEALAKDPETSEEMAMAISHLALLVQILQTLKSIEDHMKEKAQ